MVTADEPGEPLTLSITVLDQTTGDPVPQAEVWLRQTSDAGLYAEDAQGRPRIQATVLSDAAGRLRVATILPGRYPDDPTASRHIHVSVTAAGYQPLERVILFDNDPYLTAAERNWEFGVVAEMVQTPAGVWQTELELALTPGAEGAFQTFTLVAAQSRVAYRVEEEFLNRQDWLAAHGLTAGLATAIGATSEVTGSMRLDLGQTPPAVGDNHFAVNLMALTSDQAGRDNTIRRDVLENGRFGAAEFSIRSLSDFPDAIEQGEVLTFRLAGEMTIREITQPVAFDVTARLEGDLITGQATTQFPMRAFSITPPSLLGILTVSDTVLIVLDFTFRAAG